jgi:exodeoxyribonuclease-5
MKASRRKSPPGRRRGRAQQPGQPHPRPPPLTPDQAQAADRIRVWLAQGEQTVVLGGYAGTGKTFTVTALLKDYLNRRPLVVTAPTHKAVHVLRGMGLPENLPALRYATIHSVLGLQPVYDMDTGEQRLRQTGPVDLPRNALLVVDECSMVGRELYAPILRAAAQWQAQVLFVGDPAQLPPVKEQASPTFTQTAHQVTLTHIVRQARDHPLLALATQLRETLDGAPFPQITTRLEAERGIAVVEPAEFEQALLASFASPAYAQDPDHCRVLTWTNARSHYYNARIRRHLLGPDADRYLILPGERLVTCNPLVARPFLLPVSTLVTVRDCHVDVDEFGVEVYRLQLINLPGESLAPSPAGWVTYQQVLSELVRTAQGLQQEKAMAGARYSKAQDDCRRAAWRAFFQFKERYADLRPPHAGTIHRSQGSTYDMAYLDLTDIGRNTKWYEIAKLLYVGLTRPRHAVLATGALPARLYDLPVEPHADGGEAPEPLTAMLPDTTPEVSV